MSGIEKYIEIEIGKSTFNVWTKKFGENPRVKILLVHGGPGGSYHTFESMKPYFIDTGYEFYYYDQLGSYLSDTPDDPSLWHVDRFVDELEQVRQALGLSQDNFFLLGQSWGGMVAMEYAFRYQQHLKALIISSMQASIDDNTRYVRDVLANGLDPEFTEKVEALERAGDYGEAYDRLMAPFYLRHVIRIPEDEWPDSIKNLLKYVNKDIYNYMYGKSEFGCTGTLQGWDIKDRIHEIKVPTLVIGSEYNTMDPKQLRWMAKEMEQGEYFHCPEGSHMCHWDDKVHYYDGLLSFIERIK